jgi:beta-mannosidase
MARVVGVEGNAERALTDWEACAVPPGAADDPSKLEALAPQWIAARAPGTAAAALRTAKKWDVDTTRSFDAEDWWFRCRTDARGVLKLGGLATIADVWIDGAHALRSENMFVAHAVPIGAGAEGVQPKAGTPHEIAIRFSAVKKALDARRPRPRYKTRLVDHQQLRWIRTTLLGHIPGWSPPIAPVGPWRPVSIVDGPIAVERAELTTRLDGTVGVARIAMKVNASGVTAATLVVGETRVPLEVRAVDGGFTLSGEARIANAKPWWPHTHGEPALHAARVVVAGAADVSIDLGRVGFRNIELSRGADGNGFELLVNGVSIFCRGACWTTADIVSPHASRDDYARALTTARDAGMNMIRIGGTMLYEADDFYDLCDELGILVWQDFMFANMDYPIADEAFRANVTREIDHTLDRLQAHPSVAVLCGNSEIEQQAAMLGLPREAWTSPLFSEILPAACARWMPGVPYWSSSPSGGTFPFHTSTGVTHYYGVGAYQRPLEDARRANVRFTSECLGFANVPEQATIDRLLPGGEAPFHHPIWKGRTPRDAGAGWDFEDVRDHYMRALFDVDPAKLRYADIDRYLALARVTTGEVLARTFAEWRRRGSTCRGALVWFLRDLWPGAGWGLVDSTGLPKAAMYILSPVLAPVALLAIDEGLDGLFAHAVNDGARDLDAEIEATLWRHGSVRVTSATRAIAVPARSTVAVHVDALFEGFLDTTYAYRFGPPGHDLVELVLRDRASSARLADALYFPLGLTAARDVDVGLEAIAEPQGDAWKLTLRAKKVATFVAIDAGDFVPDASYVHVAPGSERTIVLRGKAGAKPSGIVQPLNAYSATKIEVRAS